MNETWVAALLTPTGMSAIAVVGVRGKAALAKLDSLIALRSAKALEQLEPGAIGVAEFAHNHANEEVVVVRTDGDTLEIQCHGGRVAAESILRSIETLGGKIVSMEQWAQVTEGCPLRAAAILALSQASAPEPTCILLDQYRGALRQEIERALAELEQSDALSAHARLVELVGRSRIGLRLTGGFRVALLGRPNVGKSSLFNALLGFGRAIVLDEPGTTRDVLAAQAAFGGWPVTLQDLAGVRESADSIEVEGVRRARLAAKQADLVLLVADSSQPWTDEDSDLLSEFREALVVHNKSDLPANETTRPRGIQLSAHTRAGLPELESAMLSRLIQPALSRGAAVPFSETQVKACTRAAAFAKSSQIENARQELLRLLSARVYAEVNSA